MTSRSHAKIIVFGLAKVSSTQSVKSNPDTMATLEIDSAHLTSPGSTLGTVAYMSPEQVRAKNLDARSDLFSFGVILYEMATGLLPFRGESIGVIYTSILERAPVPAVRLNPGLPAKLDEIIGKALEKDRTLRYQHARELGGDFENIGMAHLSLAQGDYDQAIAYVMKQIGRSGKRNAIGLYWLSSGYAGKGDKENALAALQKAFNLEFRDFAAIDAAPYFSSLRVDSRFKQLVREYRK